MDQQHTAWNGVCVCEKKSLRRCESGQKGEKSMECSSFTAESWECLGVKQLIYEIHRLENFAERSRKIGVVKD